MTFAVALVTGIALVLVIPSWRRLTQSCALATFEFFIKTIDLCLDGIDRWLDGIDRWLGRIARWFTETDGLLVKHAKRITSTPWWILLRFTFAAILGAAMGYIILPAFADPLTVAESLKACISVLFAVVLFFTLLSDIAKNSVELICLGFICLAMSIGLLIVLV